jgi:polysaccharide pyruvyl transferase CsaB
VNPVKASKPNVVFLGTHGQYNIGDELLLETFLHQCGTDFSYVINTYDVDFTAAQIGERYEARFIDTSGSKVAVARALKNADAVIFGGGSILKELSTDTGRFKYSTMLMILGVVTFAKVVSRVPVAMLNIGVGPIRTSAGRRLARAALKRVDMATVRDAASAKLCRDMGLGDKVKLSVDAVMAQSAEWLVGGDRPSAPSGDPVRIAVNLNHDIAQPEHWDHFLAVLADVLVRQANARPIEVHGLPMQSRGKSNDDATVLRALMARIPEVAFVEHRPETHVDAARIIAACDVVLSERFHALVMAAILGVAPFALSYDVKVRQLATQLGIEDFCVELDGNLTADDLDARLTEVLKDHGGYGDRARERARLLGDQARADFADVRTWLADKVGPRK